MGELIPVNEASIKSMGAFIFVPLVAKGGVMDREKENALLKERVRTYILKLCSEEFADKRMTLYDGCFVEYYDCCWLPKEIATEIIMNF